MKTHTDTQVAAIKIDEIEFTETPTEVIAEAIREYQKSKSDLKTEDAFSADFTWGFLAHQVVGHEVGQ
jgi:hypothetical protein